MDITNDLIHLTQGELLIKYWWLWLGIILLAVINHYINKED